MGTLVALASFLGGLYLHITGQRYRNESPTEEGRHKGTERQTIGVVLLCIGPFIGAYLEGLL